MLAVVLEADLAVNLGEERVILAQADVQTRLEPAALLTDEDRTARDHVAVVTLDPQPLRVRVAAVAGTALPFFVSLCMNLRAECR